VAADWKVVIYARAMTDAAIRWPDRFSPARAPVHVVNSLSMVAEPEAVWRALVRAADWPGFYANAANVAVAGGGAELSAGARFTWRTFGVDLKSEVREFEPPSRIAWLALAPGIEAYHAWLITPEPGGCTVLTEETQRGFVARAGRLIFPGRMELWHQRWLEGLARTAAT
jgi:Polyketide cyclase / dehydrase and lipid transport